MTIRIDRISKTFGDFQALPPLSLNIEDGEMIGLLGPSGSGKTTLLRIIAGLAAADSGELYFGTRRVTAMHVRERRVGFVFQNYALFRHMTVAENIAFGLEVKSRAERPSRSDIDRRVTELLEKVQLGHLSRRYPAQLSGGQKQRVALARALATEPEVLLLDEPFGALDAKVRKELRQWLRSLHDELGFTSVFVTHDQEEALELSDRVIVMNQGVIEQVDEPARLYNSPASRFVFEFLGHVNVFSGALEGGRKLVNGQAWIRLPDPVEASGAELYLRSHELLLRPRPDETACLPLEVASVSPVGSEVRLELKPSGWTAEGLWEASVAHSAFGRWQLEKGDSVFAVPASAHIFSDHAEPQIVNWSRSGNLTAVG